MLIVAGFNVTHSFTSDVSRLFTSSPTNTAVWIFVGGVIAASAAVSMLCRRPKHPKLRQRRTVVLQRPLDPLASPALTPMVDKAVTFCDCALGLLLLIVAGVVLFR